MTSSFCNGYRFVIGFIIKNQNILKLFYFGFRIHENLKLPCIVMLKMINLIPKNFITRKPEITKVGHCINSPQIVNGVFLKSFLIHQSIKEINNKFMKIVSIIIQLAIICLPWAIRQFY